jgi:hypothetical protein
MSPKNWAHIPCKWVLSYNEKNLTWWPKKPTWYWASSPHNNGFQCYNSLTNHSLLTCSTTKEANPFQGIPEIGKYWDNLTVIAQGLWKMPDGLFWICGKWDSLPLNRKLYYRDCQPRFFLFPTPKENNWKSLSLKSWGPEQREVSA